MSNYRVFELALALLLLLTLSAAADLRAASTMQSPTAVLGTDLGEYSPDNNLANMIDQSGLDKPFTSGVTDFDAYFTTGAPPFAQANFLNNWQSQVDFTLPVSGHVDFDFGTVHAIDRLAIWNISLKDVRILASDTSPAPGDLVEIADFTLPNHLNFPFSYNPTLLDLGGVHDARYLRLQIDSVHLFDPSDTFGYAIVGEVVAASVVPEPSACALLAAAALVTTRRARRR